MSCSDEMLIDVRAEHLANLMRGKPLPLKAQAPYETRREYALPNFANSRIYLACRLWVAMLRLGVA